LVLCARRDDDEVTRLDFLLFPAYLGETFA
jgi:hypothetical protein